MTVNDLIERLGGELILGDPQIVIAGVGSTDAAKQFELVFGESQRAGDAALESGAGAVVVSLGFVPPTQSRIAVIAARQPRLWFAQAAKLLTAEMHATGIHPTAVIAPDAVLGEGVSVGPGAAIGDMAVEIGRAHV